jgi:hypothetical protein
MKEEKVSKINWQGIPLEAFRWSIGALERKDGINRDYPLGDGVLERFLGDMFVRIRDDYEKLMSDEEWHRYEEADEVPLICDGNKSGELALLTFWDLSAILETFAALEEERERGDR